jgi:hypothetical protein
MRELGALVNAWDPAGLVSAGAPADEYECPLFSRLSQGVSPHVLAEWLRVHVTERFGSDPIDSEQFVQRVIDWYAR